MSQIEIVSVTDESGAVVAAEWLVKAEPVHRQLRPHLKSYVDRLREVFASGGRMAVAVKDGKVLGITVYRIQERTHSGRELYCDDLITDEAQRSTGVGHALMPARIVIETAAQHAEWIARNSSVAVASAAAR